MSNEYIIYDYVDYDGVNVVKTWLGQLDIKVKAKFNARLSTLEQLDRIEWGKCNTEVLKGDKDGLIAVRVEFNKIQYRILGYFGPGRGEFTLLACCRERENKYIPLNIGRTAFEHRTAIEANPIDRRVRHDLR
jgi:hypothetical protein